MFSEAVDKVIARSGRPDRVLDIIAYVNQTIREAQSHERSLYYRDLYEDTITTTATPHIWTRPHLIRKLRTVKYTQTGYEDIYPRLVMPGRKQGEREVHDQLFYYGASGYYAFSGVSVGQTIALAYYRHSPYLEYYSAATRPASFNQSTGVWTYLDPQPADTDEEEAIQYLVSNWLLESYFETIVQGALAKIFNAVSDPRAPSSYSLWKQYVNDIRANEQYESLDY